MPDLTLKMLLLGQDVSQSRAVRGVGDELDKTSGKAHAMGTAVKVGMAGVGAGIGLLLKTGFDEAKDASEVTAQLEAGIASTGNAANTSVDELNALAGAIQGYSGQTDDSIAASEKLLLTFTNIKNVGPDRVFDEATRATADMAAKMGGDASSYAVQLGKALNDPVKGITALTKIGVSFTAQQKEQVKAMVATGDTAGAQKLILAELNKEFGGAAEAAGKSLPGQMERAKRSFEDTSQAVVSDLLPVFNTLLGVVSDDLLPLLDTAAGFWMDNKTAIGLAVLVIGGAVGVVKAVTLATRLWNVVTGVQAVLQGRAAAATGLQTTALLAQRSATAIAAGAQWLLNAAMTANPIGLVIAAIALLVAGFVLAYRHSETFRRFVQAAFRGVQEAASFMWNGVLKPVFRFVVEAFLLVASTIIHAAANAFGWIPGLGGKLKSAARQFDTFRDNVNRALDQTQDDYTLRAHVEGANAVISSLQTTAGLLAYINSNRQVDIGVSGRGVAGRATGGPVRKGTPYVVGEHRPELFIPDQDGAIVPEVPYLGLNGPGRLTAAPAAGYANRPAAEEHFHLHLAVTQPLANEEQIVRAVLPALQKAKARGVPLGLGDRA